MIEIIRYDSTYKQAWNQAVTNGKNSHFMFDRDYMEYHADKFADASLLFFQETELVAVLPASKHDDMLITHGGLTFGGLVINKKIKASQVLDLFEALKQFLSQNHFKTLRYKAIPYIYHDFPAAEDLYALFRGNAALVRRDISSTIFLNNKIGFSGGKKNGLAKAKKANLTIKECTQFDKFYVMLNEILTDKYETQATHNANEMILLNSKFPDNIKLFGVFKEEDMVAGAIMYLTKTVAHTQYLATTDIGRDTGALDYLLYYLINDLYAAKQFFDFGISTEQQGWHLNTGLISQKEMFGARAVVYDTYELPIGSPLENSITECHITND